MKRLLLFFAAVSALAAIEGCRAEIDDDGGSATVSTPAVRVDAD